MLHDECNEFVEAYMYSFISELYDYVVRSSNSTVRWSLADSSVPANAAAAAATAC